MVRTEQRADTNVSVDQLAITVRPETDSVAAVRHFVDFAQHILGSSADRAVAAVVTSELVANAVEVAAGEITVTIRCVGHNLRVEVQDHGYGMPEVQHPSPDDAGGGRGLMIVEELADQWGVQQFLPGKIVWFELAPGAADVTERRGTMHG
jgi:anti-sigma regulatory factor (Ser/Thr protein kinase)